MSRVSILNAEARRRDPASLAAIYRLRHKVFYERLGWDVANANGYERDDYDQLDPVYLTIRNDDGELEGCWRLLPTTGPYMLKDLFSELLDGEPAPCDPAIWEISRFAVMPTDCTYDSLAALHDITSSMLIGLLEFCLPTGIRRVVAASDVRFERILHRAGLKTGRMGEVHRIGVCRAVAGWTDVTEENLMRVRRRQRALARVGRRSAAQRPVDNLGDVPLRLMADLARPRTEGALG